MSKSPDFNVCCYLPAVNRDDGRKGWFKQIGVAWLDNKTGQISLKIDTAPVSWDGKLRLFPRTATIASQSQVEPVDGGEWITNWDK